MGCSHPASHRPCSFIASGPRLALPWFAACGLDRPGCIAVCRSGARACSRMGARARVGLLPGGPGGRSGLVSGGLVSGMGTHFVGAGFLEAMAGSLLSLAENHNRTTTDLTAESQSAQRLSRLRLRGQLRLDDPCGPWLGGRQRGARVYARLAA